MKTLLLFLTFTAFYLLRGVSGGHSSAARENFKQAEQRKDSAGFDKLFLTDNL